MKVLKRVPWAYKFTCKGCKSELEAERTDVKVGTFGACHYAGDSGETKFYVDCAVCGDPHTINDSKIPQDVANENEAKRD